MRPFESTKKLAFGFSSLILPLYKALLSRELLIMEELFNKYTEAFNAFEPEAIASLYRLPCAISDADGVQTFTERTALVAKFALNCESMRNFGYQHAQFTILEQQALGKDKVAATVGWRVTVNDSNVDFRT
ncbi:ketosteroid isomerase family protein [Alteromonas sp.]|nr:ketosteroid isomerase family protein [Alteromonas sp.]